jgi:hypothetical protein
MEQTLCRSKFTRDDLNFVVDHLGRSLRLSDAVQRLCQDQESLDQILDLEGLHQALVDQPHCVQVSPAFYFYVLTRRALLRHGLDDRNLCDYVAAVLTDFTQRQNIDKVAATESTRTFAYVSDLLQSIERAPAAQIFSLRRFLADYTLFLSGVFKENIEAREQKRGAPGLSFYEAVGRQSYRSAAAQPQALREDLRDLLDQIAEAFHEVRLALNALSDQAFHFEPTPKIITDN